MQEMVEQVFAHAHYLNTLGARYRRVRRVENEKYITAVGVSAGIDMALHLAARLTSQDRATDSGRAGIRPAATLQPDGLEQGGRGRHWSRLGDADARSAYFTPLLQSRPDVLEKMLAWQASAITGRVRRA
jgi:hypothetical protein